MRRSLKMWSNFVLYLAVLVFVLTLWNGCIFKLGTELAVVLSVLGILFGWFYFKRTKVSDDISRDGLLFESVFGVNYDIIKNDKSAVLWEDLDRANVCLEEYKKTNNFEWGTDSLYDILVVSYVDDTKTEIVVNRYNNTRKLEFKGILKITDTKMKLDSLDLSNFDTSIVTELGNYSGKECVLRAVRPKNKGWLLDLFENSLSDDDLKSHVFDVETV